MSLVNVKPSVILDIYDHNLTPSSIKTIALDSKTRFVAAVIRNRGEIYDIGQDAAVALTVVRPDKTRVQITGQTYSLTETTRDDETITYYGASAELTQLALAIKGNLRAQFKITSGEQELRTEIFTINNGEALDAGDDPWAGDLDGHNLDEMAQSIEDLSSDVSEIQTDVSELKSGFNDLYNTAYVTDSANGSVAHFVDGADNVPMKSVDVNIAPVQSGSGDPSPDNVRPISGFSSVKVTRNGRNFCKSAVTATRTNLNGLTATPNGDGSITINGTATATTILYFNLAVENGANSASQANGTKNLHSGTYRFKELPSGIYLQIYGSDMPNAGTSDARLIKEGRKGSFTVDDTYQYNWIRLLAEKDTTFNNVVIYPAIYLASDTEETYEPYDGNTYEVSLASAGTVYGGTLDVISGELVIDRRLINLSTSGYTFSLMDAAVYPNNYVYRNYSIGNMLEKNNSGDITKIVCNYLPSIARNNVVVGVFQIHDGNANEVRLSFPKEDRFATWDNLQEWMRSLADPFVLCIPLDDSLKTTYNLTPTEVKSLFGINNVWSDAGDVEVEYRADTKLYIDKRLAEVTA